MYFIIELQTFSDGTASHLVVTESARNQAESVYHQKLAYAAISELPFHAVALLDNKGNMLRQWCYEHPAQPEQGEEPANE